MKEFLEYFISIMVWFIVELWFFRGLFFIVCLRESWSFIFYFSIKGGFEGDDDLGEIIDLVEESEENEE